MTNDGADMNLYQRILEVQKAITYLRKENVAKQYSYVSSSQVLSAIRETMDRVGLVLEIAIVKSTLHLNAAYDNKQHLTELVLEMTWVNADNPPDQKTFRWYGQGIDAGEKGVGKALTYAEKYFILKFFHVATDMDDPDAFQGKQNGSHSQQPPANQPTPFPVRAALDRTRANTGNRIAAKQQEALGQVKADEFRKHLGEHATDEKLKADLFSFMQQRWSGVTTIAGVPAADERELYEWVKKYMGSPPPDEEPTAADEEPWESGAPEGDGPPVPLKADLLAYADENGITDEVVNLCRDWSDLSDEYKFTLQRQVYDIAAKAAQGHF